MTALLITIVSILTLTGVMYLANRVLGFRICPICAGVSGTWIWIIFGMFADILPASSFNLIAALLMGGSVVGIAYQMEKLRPLHDASAGKLLLWKTLFIPTGFALVYFALTRTWGAMAVALAVLAAILVRFFGWRKKETARSDESVAELEEKMKKCC